MANDEATTDENAATFSGRRLKCSEPDLEVEVGSDGENRKVFYHYSMILARDSEYVDAAISVPMKEREAKKVAFPDIPPQLWTKMMKFLEPGGSVGLSLEDAHEMLPFFDEYGFRSALTALDSFLLPSLTEFADKDDEESVYDASAVTTAALAFQANLLKCKSKAVKCAEMMFSEHAKELLEDDIARLVPLIQDSGPTLRTIAAIMHRDGIIPERGLDECRDITLEGKFPSKFRTRCREIGEQLEMFLQLNVKSVEVLSSGSNIANGQYSLAETYNNYDDDFMAVSPRSCIGILRYEYAMDFPRDGIEPPLELCLCPIDPFGRRWEIYSYDRSLDEPPCQIYFYWESENGSLAPPRGGWRVGEAGTGPVPEIRFQFG